MSVQGEFDGEEDGIVQSNIKPQLKLFKLTSPLIEEEDMDPFEEPQGNGFVRSKVLSRVEVLSVLSSTISSQLFESMSLEQASDEDLKVEADPFEEPNYE
ncbi:unnamed protein product [Toxocara canis]|uniref:Ovule protein n=1 Tax=Toxocara canis TaxID=6265 RepID=A0A183TVS7_TOXCA|nr:unnamed protein product [Toxocara canis]